MPTISQSSAPPAPVADSSSMPAILRPSSSTSFGHLKASDRGGHAPVERLAERHGRDEAELKRRGRRAGRAQQHARR